MLDRIARLEQRISQLERVNEPPPWPTLPPADTGTVSYSGDVTLSGHVAWTMTLSAGAVLELPDPPVATVLSGLGHPARVAMIRRLLLGAASVAELQQSAGGTSTGQLYHHLRALTGCGLAEQDGRGRYRVPATAVVPILTMLLAAADVAGELRPGRTQARQSVE